jgi:putative endonuclease
MNTTESGRRAETAAGTYLEMRGYNVIEKNFRRPHCEIDIVAEKDKVVHFVEVKYRRNYDQGGGLETITASKLHHMTRGAEIWVEEYKWQGEHVLSVIEIAGTDYMVMNFIENAY